MPPAAGRGDRRRPRGERRSRTPTSPSRARATASAARPPSAARSRPSCRSSARSSASSRPTPIEPVDAAPASTPGGARRAASRGRAAAGWTQAGRPWTPRRRSSSSCCCCVVALGARLRGPADRHRVPDPPGPRRARPGLRPRRVGNVPAIELPPERRLPAVPAADPVRGRLRHADPRLQGEPARHRPAGGRARAVHDDRRRARRERPHPRASAGRPAFALGAIVAPPDAVAATAIFRRLGVPSTVVTILEGESLINDASALIALPGRARWRSRPARSRSPGRGCRSSSSAVGGFLVGIVVGTVVAAAWQRTTDATLEIVLSLLAPLIAYLPAESIGVSGVLATVTAGVIAGRQAARALSPGRAPGRARRLGRRDLPDQRVRVPADRPAAAGDPGRTRSGAPTELVGLGAAISLTVIVARIVWVFPATYLPRRLSAKVRARDPARRRGRRSSSCRGPACAAWSRCAAALSLPARRCPDRDLVIFLTFCVILATLVGQGLSLPWVVHRLGVVAGRARTARRPWPARRPSTRRCCGSTACPRSSRTTSRSSSSCASATSTRPATPTNGAAAVRRRDRPGAARPPAIRLSIVAAQREAVIRLRDDGAIGDEALHRVERDLDLEAVRTGV